MSTLVFILILILQTIRLVLSATLSLLDAFLIFLNHMFKPSLSITLSPTYNSHVLHDRIMSAATFHITENIPLHDIIDTLISPFSEPLSPGLPPPLSDDMHHHMRAFNYAHPDEPSYLSNLTILELLQQKYPEFQPDHLDDTVFIQSTHTAIAFSPSTDCFVFPSLATHESTFHQIPFETLASLAISAYSLLYNEVPFSHFTIKSNTPIYSTIFHAYSSCITWPIPSLPLHFSYLTFPYQHLSPFATHIELFPTLIHLSNFASSVARSAFIRKFETLQSLHFMYSQSTLHVLETSYAIKFMTNSPHRAQVHALLQIPLFPFFSAIMSASSIFEPTDSLPGSFHPSPSAHTFLKTISNLPYEIQQTIYYQCITMPFSKCHCDTLECHKRKHNNRCRKGKQINRRSKLPKLFPIGSRFSFENSNPTSHSLILQFVATFPLLNGQFTLDQSSRILETLSIPHQFVILSPLHGQFSIQPPDPTHSLRLLNSTKFLYSPMTTSQCSSLDDITPCPQHVDQFIPMSRHIPKHTLVFD